MSIKQDILSHFQNNWVSWLLSLLVVVVPFMLKDVLIERFITPSVYTSFKDKNYINDDIRHGRFISTNQNAFNTNHVIESDHLLLLKNNQLIKVSDFEAYKQKTREHIHTLNAQINAFKVELDILKAREIGEIELTLFNSERSSEAGYIILNKDNPAIYSLIQNNRNYAVISSSGNKMEFKIRLQDLRDRNNQQTSNSIGRLYIEDYHKLFNQEKGSGIGKAKVLL